jgi:phospholipase C
MRALIVAKIVTPSKYRPRAVPGHLMTISGGRFMNRGSISSLAVAVGASLALSAPLFAQAGANDGRTRTPIKHVIIIIGENRSFDHSFGTFVPAKGQTISNLLSKGIVNADGTPGPNFNLSAQYAAVDTGKFSIHPPKTSGYAGGEPPVNTQGSPGPDFTNFWTAHAVEPSLWFESYGLLLTGGSGLPADEIDPRFPNPLATGVYQISKYVPYDSYTSSPVHRFYQMWQQIDCDPSKITANNNSGCQSDLFAWVEATIGTGSNGKAQAAGFNDETTGEGSTSLGFFNVSAGDMPYFTSLATQYALGDNMHQSIEGGTGANHIFLGYGDAIYYANPDGTPGTPPSNQIENPDPQAGTNNWWTQDGYSGGSYVGCWNDSLPGIKAVKDYLHALPYNVFKRGDCAKNAYYLVNNYNPGYFGTGVAAPLGAQVFTIPPTRQKNLALLLEANKISWKYYGEGWASGSELGEGASYCNICNPFLYSTQIMTNPTLRAKNQDIQNLYADITNNTLPAVSIVKPDGIMDGHPASSKLDLFEEFSKKIVQMAQANPAVWSDVAIMITYDEGGGYYDSGYIQPLDFFGDGTRIPMIVVSPYSKGVGMVHEYNDHVSMDKFVEYNWGLQTISNRSRDNLPNPIVSSSNPYVPLNSPALGDMTNYFNFSK